VLFLGPGTGAEYSERRDRLSNSCVSIAISGLHGKTGKSFFLFHSAPEVYFRLSTQVQHVSLSRQHIGSDQLRHQM
jgi:hypothetical protein